MLPAGAAPVKSLSNNKIKNPIKKPLKRNEG
jgi:hypothetical protein